MEFLQSIDWALWLDKLLRIVVILAITWLVSHYVTRATHHLLRRDDVDLPANTILVNIVRFFVWIAGISIVLYFCFNIEMTAVIAALGIGGIALSLGFQDTLSDLIGGVQLSMGKVVQTGEFVRYGKTDGKVLDVTWRDTRIQDSDGYVHIIPNSTLNSQEVVQLDACQNVDIPLFIPDGSDVEATLVAVRDRVAATLAHRPGLAGEPEVLMNGSIYGGMQAVIRIPIEWFSMRSVALRDEISQAVADCVVPAVATGE